MTKYMVKSTKISDAFCLRPKFLQPGKEPLRIQFCVNLKQVRKDFNFVLSILDHPVSMKQILPKLAHYYLLSLERQKTAEKEREGSCWRWMRQAVPTGRPLLQGALSLSHPPRILSCSFPTQGLNGIFHLYTASAWPVRGTEPKWNTCLQNRINCRGQLFLQAPLFQLMHGHILKIPISEMKKS